MSATDVAPFAATVVGLFPEIVTDAANRSILGRAQEKGRLAVGAIQLRDFADDKHRTVDDTPAGGGPGMVLKVDVLARAIAAARARPAKRPRVVLLDAAGTRFTQQDARRLATHDHIIFVCGRYEGVDARIHSHVDEILSIGDFVLTGGEVAAGVILDAVARHVPGVLGNQASSEVESHERPRLEHRQYTRPAAFEGERIPSVLAGGNHALVKQARDKDGLLRTQSVRPDLIAAAPLSDDEKKLLNNAKIPPLDPEQDADTGTD